jgi:hypothetical protein
LPVCGAAKNQQPVLQSLLPLLLLLLLQLPAAPLLHPGRTSCGLLLLT